MWLLAGAVVLLASACGSSGNGDIDHRPRPGLGSLVVDNQSDEAVEVFVDQSLVFRVREFDNEFVDLEPAEYRLVVNEQNGGHTAAENIDILVNRVLVVQVGVNAGGQYELTNRYQ